MQKTSANSRGPSSATLPVRQDESDNLRFSRLRPIATEDRCIKLSNPPIRSSPLRKRLWLAGLGILLFITTLAVGNSFTPADKAVTRRSAGHDFLAFYTAGTFVRTGRLQQLYDLPSVRAFERDLIDRQRLELGADDFGPYWNPPFFAWLFVPLSAMSYHAAWTTWFIFNLGCCAVATALLCRVIARVDHDWRSWGLVPLLIVTSMPFIQALGHGQNTGLSLMLVTLTIFLWRDRRTFAAGIVAGLLFYKPQLGAIVAAALVISAGWKPLAGLAITGVSLLIVNLITLPGTLGDFLRRLPQNLAWMQVEHRYLWDRHVTLKAFWRLLVQGYEIGDMSAIARLAWIITAAALAACVFASVWRSRRDASPDRAIAATIAAMPLLMPFYFDYDLLLLAVPATLYAADRLARSDRGEARDRAIVWTWIALFGWMFVNPAVGGRTHVNVTVLLLSGVTTMLIARAMRLHRGEAAQTAEPMTAHRAAA